MRVRSILRRTTGERTQGGLTCVERSPGAFPSPVASYDPGGKVRTGSAGEGIFSLPNRWMAVACGGTTTDGVAIVGADVLAATDVGRVDCKAWPKRIKRVVGLRRLVGGCG